jgi:hypothetical protein
MLSAGGSGSLSGIVELAPECPMKFLPLIAMVIAQQGATILFMECVCRDLFLACGLSALVGIAAYLLVLYIQRRIASRKVGT